ncbi:hypothetical protein HBI56_080150 [Parastagonospora nodorum]|uniref:Uncharacterized protein n=1 Tax=Phaeosphaeria nodorum (strain SN15 / ATCC MYA-4574 / FGSC 10173) TaxID=321614 RepID=A0A7U2FGH8_PHANO|nr:hypothetical protein HBH56_106580 [Parastagonospora nodorum]QRD04845.1 hypothetical protein JI435_421840 [Parastagonospora nodorum SN15]KAH3929432.1 hypothetical protein HBH54_123850 [Parastagonospora nodorum]KAH3951343.1 hypothetical protein HBH53_057850 [Parastagonospora nodorum]KAH3975250.1 hypothetical protein HBH52_129040 [Parastagonospora nodorum]
MIERKHSAIWRLRKASHHTKHLEYCGSLTTEESHRGPLIARSYTQYRQASTATAMYRFG